MLSFLHLARVAGFTVSAYEDHVEGMTEEIAPARLAVTKVKLRPKLSGLAPPRSRRRSTACTMRPTKSASVKTQITVE
jgi:hypothetical protein